MPEAARRQQRGEWAREDASVTSKTTNKTSLAIDAALIAEGTAQLDKEIKVLESWLAEIEDHKSRSAEAQAAHKSYSDMLVSRREMLETLQKQTPAK